MKECLDTKAHGFKLFHLFSNEKLISFPHVCCVNLEYMLSDSLVTNMACRCFSGIFDVFVCLICHTGIQVFRQSYIPRFYNVQGRSSTDLFTHLFWI